MKPSGPPNPHVRSPSFVPRGPKLTNARIAHYIKLGHYGEEARLRHELAHPKATPRKPKTKPPNVDFAVSILG